MAALCKQSPCSKAAALHLGSGCGLKLGRQAAWRPGPIGLVSSGLVAALCKQLLCLKVTVLHLGSGCGLRLGRQAAWRPGVFQNGVVTIGGGTVQAVAVFRGDCLVRGLWLWASTWPSSCLAAVNVAASRCFNCCCNQQRRGGVTSFNCCCEQQ